MYNNLPFPTSLNRFLNEIFPAILHFVKSNINSSRRIVNFQFKLRYTNNNIVQTITLYKQLNFDSEDCVQTMCSIECNAIPGE